jgi:hypothetical protein
MNVTRRLLGGATAMILAFGLSTGAALAGNGHGRGHGNGHAKGHGHGHAQGVYTDYRPVHRSGGHARFAVPHRIVHASTYAPYYTGRVYYAPHHHVHAAYAFPVYGAYGVRYAPYYYCGPELFVAAPGYAYPPPAPYYGDGRTHVSVGIQFGF